MILPPPALRNIVDKTASFVAKNGLDFADKIRKEKEKDPKFNFLAPTDPYHAYYRSKVQDYLEGKTDVVAAAPSAGGATSEEIAEANRQDAELIDAPPEYEFIADSPSTSAQDLDIVRLTARFVAQNGRPFLNALMAREIRNWQFDFTKMQHPLFSYFSTLVEQYIKILRPNEDTKTRLKHQAESKQYLLEQVKYSTSWQKQKQRIQKKQEEAEKAEQVAYQQIDWHDFVIVETLDFTAQDIDLPTPIQRADLASRLIEEHKYERIRELEEAKMAELELNAAIDEAGEDDMDTNMEVEMEEEDSAPEPAPVVEDKFPKVPLEALPSTDITIKNYDPKAKAEKRAAAVASEQYLISPVTGEAVPASKLQDHVRINLLGPDAAAKKNKLEEERRQNKEIWSIGSSTALDNLKEVAKKRTDIFGRGDLEMGIGYATDDDKPKKTIWDFAEPSAPKNITSAPITSAPPMPQKPDPPKPVTTPKPPPPPTPTPSLIPNPVPPPKPAPPSIPAPTPPTLPSSLIATPPVRPAAPSLMPAPFFPAAPPVGATSLMPGLPFAVPGFNPLRPPVPIVAPVANIPLSADQGEPAAKRSKTEEQLERLQPEEEFLKTHSGNVTFTIAVSGEEGPTHNISITRAITEKVADLKTHLQEQTGMPISKQKLQIGELVLNNANTLAFYNVTSATLAQLSAKQRGGRK